MFDKCARYSKINIVNLEEVILMLKRCQGQKMAYEWQFPSFGMTEDEWNSSIFLVEVLLSMAMPCHHAKFKPFGLFLDFIWVDNSKIMVKTYHYVYSFLTIYGFLFLISILTIRMISFLFETNQWKQFYQV